MQSDPHVLPRSKVAVIACTKAKRRTAAPAIQLYDRSELFRLCVATATSDSLPVLVLSSKYGLVEPDAVLDTYEVDLAKLTPSERSTWQALVDRQAQALIPGRGFKEVTCLAGKEYRQAMHAACAALGVRVVTHPRWRALCDQAFGRSEG